MRVSKNMLAAVLALSIISPTIVQAEPEYNSINPDSKVITQAQNNCQDSLLKTKLQAIYTLNSVLSPFNVNVEVEDGVATISGALQNEVQKDLAITLAHDIDGIQNINDKIEINPNTVQGESNSASGLLQKVNDATVTAAVKTKFLADRQITGRDITVTTVNNIVTLEGKVKSKQEKLKAAVLAAKTLGVSAVKNKLTVAS